MVHSFAKIDRQSQQETTSVPLFSMP